MSGTELAIAEGGAFLIIVLASVGVTVAKAVEWWRNR